MLSLLPKGSRVLLLGLVALLIFFALPPLLRLVDPTAGGFAPDTINAAALGAFHFFASLSMAYISWRGLFPSLYAYAAECMEGKLLEAITKDLFDLLPNPLNFRAEVMLATLAERRKIATLQFTIRCVRFVFSVLPFFVFFALSNHALTAALTAVPSAAPAL